MIVLRVSIHVEEGILRLRLNDQLIPLEVGSSELEIADCGAHVLQWWVEGRRYTSYAVTISHPKEAELHWMRVIDHTGKDFGGIKFTV